MNLYALYGSKNYHNLIMKKFLLFLLCSIALILHAETIPKGNFTFTATPAEGQYPTPLKVQFQADVPDAVAYEWVLSTKTSLTGATASFTYESAKQIGAHGITLVVTYADGRKEKVEKEAFVQYKPIITNNAIVFGLLAVLLGLVFYTAASDKPIFKKFYTVVPVLLMCYLLPALLSWPLGLTSGDDTFNVLYKPMASRYLLPASLVLLCISIDFKGLLNLGPKAIIMFLAGTVGIVIGGPIAILLVSLVAPEITGGTEELWRGLSTIAGSWIGGGANMTAMKEIYEVGDSLFSSMVVIDVVVANIWMAFLLYGVSISKKIDKWFKADASAIDDLKQRVENYEATVNRNPSTNDYFYLLAVGFGATALAHFGADILGPAISGYNDANNGVLDSMGLSSLKSSFFWLIVIATTIGLGLSFTKLRSLGGAGASKIGSVFIYILVATIGLKMNIGKVFDNLDAFAIGMVWMMVHVIVLLSVGKLIKAPFFFTAVGSQANVGGAASAPVVAAAFSPALAPVGALMAVLGYALGTYGAILCAILMQAAS